MKLTDVVKLKVGSPQFRIKESLLRETPSYNIYSQNDLEEDLAGIKLTADQPRQIRTQEKVTTLATNDVVFSLISGKAAIVNQQHQGYLYTQNYVVLKADGQLDERYLVYLLNEDQNIAKQFWLGLQGSSVTKYTVKQLRELKLPKLPPMARQTTIGEIYVKQHHLQALKQRKAQNETLLRLAKLKEANQRWTN